MAMEPRKKETEREWARQQIEMYGEVRPRYEKYATVLKQILERSVKKYAPLAIVQVRAKTIASFAEKTQRKKIGHPDPVNQFTDLCGARVIVHTPDEVRAICEFIEKHFQIDWNNSVDVSQRLKPTEFGYRSVHYIIQFKRGVFPNKEVKVRIPDEVFPDKSCPMKAEVQVRTILEHAWADFAHDMSYKSAFKIPVRWQRELAGLAAMLEEADRAFSRIQAGLHAYAASYGTYMSKEQIRDDIETLELVLRYDPENAQIAHRIGKLAITLGNWQTAIDVLSRYNRSGYQPVLRDLGVAMCKKHRAEPNSPQYRKGQKYLEKASAPPNRDADALASLAGTWKSIADHPKVEERARKKARKKAKEYYRRAFEVDPSDPYPLGNYLEYEIADRKDTSSLLLISPVINAAIQRCRNHAGVGMNLPWAFYDMGKFYMFLDKPYESLSAYAKAIEVSTDEWMIETSLRSLEGKLDIVQDKLRGYEWVQRLLIVGWAVKSSDPDAIDRLKKLASDGCEAIQSPVVILAGGCNPSVEQQMQGYCEMLLEAFRDFKGTIISGGTTAGISGLLGSVGEKYPDTIRTISYVPKRLPSDVSIDNRYSEVRETEGDGFSPLEPLQNWIDLIASSIRPSQVKLLGINGGTIAAAEYRIALALGARVAVVEGSGGEAAKLLQDDDWGTSPMLVHLPADGMIVRAFIGSGSSRLPPDIRETIARAVHENYRSVRATSDRSQDPAMADWDKLRDDLKDSNREQVDHIFGKFRQMGCIVHEVKDRQILLMTFTNSEIETMAEMEHARWVVERLRAGWKWGDERDVTSKVSPYLVPWSELTDEVKEWDRDTVRKIPEFLARVGLEVWRQTQEADE